MRVWRPMCVLEVWGDEFIINTEPQSFLQPLMSITNHNFYVKKVCRVKLFFSPPAFLIDIPRKDAFYLLTANWILRDYFAYLTTTLNINNCRPHGQRCSIIMRFCQNSKLDKIVIMSFKLNLLLSMISRPGQRKGCFTNTVVIQLTHPLPQLCLRRRQS